MSLLKGEPISKHPIMLQLKFHMVSIHLDSSYVLLLLFLKYWLHKSIANLLELQKISAKLSYCIGT